MALTQSSSSPTFQFPFHNDHIVGKPQHLRVVCLQTTKNFRYPLISSFHTALSKPCLPLRTISCDAGALLDDGTGESFSPSTSISSVFVKGLPVSVSEGRLKKVFSEFGEVCNVKIIINERTRQSLGYGYVWFNSKEDAEFAVEAMNGKVYSC